MAKKIEIDKKLEGEEMVKVIPLAEIECARIAKIRNDKRYYNNNPDFIVLDADDPDVDKPRVAVGFAGDVVKKRTGFLVGEDKFRGPESLLFDDPKFGEVAQNVWDANRGDGKILSFVKDMYWAGFAAWKITINPLAKRKKIRFNRVEPCTLYVEFNPGEDKTKEAIYCWIIMFLNNDGSYYREEIYQDKILYFNGTTATPLEVKTYLHIEEDEFSAVTFRLQSKEENEMGVFPLIFLSRENEDSIWGKSIINPIKGRIDRINELYTNALFALGKLADPVLWAKGVKDVATLHKDPDNIWFFENPEAALNVLAWDGVPESTLTVLRKLSDQIYKESDVPLILKDAEQSIGDISGRALEILYGDTKAAVQMDRANISDWLIDLMELIFQALAVTKNLGKDLQGESNQYKTFTFSKINWGDIIPTDRSKNQEDALALFNSGAIDKLELLMKSGYSKEEAEDLLERVKKEKEETASSLPGDMSEFDDDEEEEDILDEMD